MLDGYRLITFDVYMALMDIQGGLRAAFSAATGLDDEASQALVALWRAKQMERAAASNSLDGERTSFRECTAMALDYVCDRHSLALSQAERGELIAAWDVLPPWPEADEALAAVKAKGYPIAILSNGDQAMLEAVAKQFETPFDHILSSEGAGKYKPHPRVYGLPAERLGLRSEAVLHVAGSAHDVLGTVAFGMACVWSNRGRDILLDRRYPPVREIDDLSMLPDLLPGRTGQAGVP